MGRRSDRQFGWLQMGLALVGFSAFLAAASYGNMQIAALVGLLFTMAGWGLFIMHRRKG